MLRRIPLSSFFLQKMGKGVKTNVNVRRKTSEREVCKLSSPGPDERMMFAMLWYYTKYNTKRGETE